MSNSTNKDVLVKWLLGKKYTNVDESSTEMTEEYEKEHAWELSRNSFIEETVKFIEESTKTEFNQSDCINPVMMRKLCDKIEELSKEETVTNFDKIKSLTIEQMAKLNVRALSIFKRNSPTEQVYLSSTSHTFYRNSTREYVEKEELDWLKSEYDDEYFNRRLGIYENK